MLFVNDKQLEITRFPDGTSQVWKLPEEIFKSNKVYVKWDYTGEADVMHLAQLQTLLMTVNRNTQTTLFVKYLPYARQDKPISNTATFALNVFLEIIRPLRFHKIIVMDPHNFDAVRPGCAFEAVYPTKEVAQVMELTKSELVCYPDKGALKKYTQIYSYPHIYGEKVRNQLNGQIEKYTLVGDPSGKNVLIVDDICDGGMTFILLARDLLAAGANEVNLFVTHGIFSRGLRPLKDAGIKRVFTQNGEAHRYQDQIAYKSYEEM